LLLNSLKGKRFLDKGEGRKKSNGGTMFCV